MSVSSPILFARFESSLQSSWSALANAVRSFRPEIAILVARKTPRLVELFNLDFGPQCLVVSDLAIPFIHKHIRGSRIAILDDIVNVGSTLDRARIAATEAGAAAIQSFALGTRQISPQRNPTTCVWETPLSEAEYRRLTEIVPRLLLMLPKPYDIEFPIMTMQLTHSCHTLLTLTYWLEQTFGSDHVAFCRSTSRANQLRFTVDLSRQGLGVHKLRLYFVLATHRCNLVPIHIPPRLSTTRTAAPRHPHAIRVNEIARSHLSSMPKGVALWEGEPAVRLSLYVDSLDWGLTQLERFSEIADLDSETLLSHNDIQLLFGPLPVTSLLHTPAATPQRMPRRNSRTATSPFLAFLTSKECSTHSPLGPRLDSSLRRYDAFLEFFNSLAKSVGASDPERYELDWPYSRDEICDNPYLRLRIGPTFEDLIAICRLSWKTPQEDASRLRHEVSRYLDTAIDMGGVVPTLAYYYGEYYRIYRKGEGNPRKEILDRAQFAWLEAARAMSPTRFTKINTILSFCAELDPLLLDPEPRERGLVATVPPTALDASVEITAALRASDRIEKSES